MELVTSDKEGAPAYRLFAGDVELGAAWAKTANESGRLPLGAAGRPLPASPDLRQPDGGQGYGRLRPDLEPAEASRPSKLRAPDPEPPVAAQRLPRSPEPGSALLRGPSPIMTPADQRCSRAAAPRPGMSGRPSSPQNTPAGSTRAGRGEEGADARAGAQNDSRGIQQETIGVVSVRYLADLSKG